MVVCLGRITGSRLIRPWAGEDTTVRVRWYRVPSTRACLPFPHCFEDPLQLDFDAGAIREPDGVGTLTANVAAHNGAPPPWTADGPPCGRPDAWLHGAIRGVDPPLVWRRDFRSTCCAGPEGPPVGTPYTVARFGPDGNAIESSRLSDDGTGCVVASTCLDATDLLIGGVSVSTLFSTPATVNLAITAAFATFVAQPDPLPQYLNTTRADALYDPLGAAASALASALASSLQKTANLADVASASAARANLGLGTAATADASDFQPASLALTELDALVATSVLAWHDASLGWVGLGIGSGLTISAGNLVATATGGTVTSVGITPPAAGITVSGSPVTSSGSMTLALADDLAALEALTGTNTLYYRSGTSAWSAVTIGSGLTFSGGTLDTIAVAAVPTGTLLPFGGSSAPSGYLACDGSAVSRTTYAALFAVIGTTWGPGDGSTTFNLPDLRGRTPIGAGTGSGLTARTLGTRGGSEGVVLTLVTTPGV